MSSRALRNIELEIEPNRYIKCSFKSIHYKSKVEICNTIWSADHDIVLNIRKGPACIDYVFQAIVVPRKRHGDEQAPTGIAEVKILFRHSGSENSFYSRRHPHLKK